MINDLTSGKIDAGILWGPMAGFYAKKANPPLHVTPLVKETTGPRLVFRIGMGVRPADQNWKRLLNRLIQENQPAINKIMLDFGVPLLDENDRPIGAETATKVAMRGKLAGLVLAASHCMCPPPCAGQGVPSPTNTERKITARRFPRRLPARAC